MAMRWPWTGQCTEPSNICQGALWGVREGFEKMVFLSTCSDYINGCKHQVCNQLRWREVWEASRDPWDFNLSCPNVPRFEGPSATVKSEHCGVDWRPSCRPSCPSLEEAWARMKGPENTHERTRKRRQRALILEIDGSSFHLCSRSVRSGRFQVKPFLRNVAKVWPRSFWLLE